MGILPDFFLVFFSFAVVLLVFVSLLWFWGSLLGQLAALLLILLACGCVGVASPLLWCGRDAVPASQGRVRLAGVTFSSFLLFSLFHRKDS